MIEKLLLLLAQKFMSREKVVDNVFMCRVRGMKAIKIRYDMIELFDLVRYKGSRDNQL